jgi:F0F1-type ATP synthase membrane subunit b/b'
MYRWQEEEGPLVKGTIDATGTDGTRRGLFRRTRRTEIDDPSPSRGATEDAVALVDELARRMDDLVADGAVADDPVRAEFDLQRAVIARANDVAATNIPSPTTTHTAPEALVQQPTHAIDTNALATNPTGDDIEARLDAALQRVELLPVVTPDTPSGTVTLEPTPAPTAPVEPVQAAVLAPTTPAATTPASTQVTMAPTPTAASAIGIDIDRIVQLIEDEAVGVQHRIELELRTAHARAEDIVDRAEAEAERIRDHGQAQARVLLGEVEEIISEAQQTGEQILMRANEEASSLRGEATGVLQQAQTDARAIVDTARREGEQVLAEQRRLATVRAQEAMREQDRLKDQIRRLEERRRQVLESLEPLISQLTQMMPAGIMPVEEQQNVVQLQRQQPNQG